MTAPLHSPPIDADDHVFARALDARDARFDGVFFVGITTTGIYCRPVCPARVSDHRRRRFFVSAAAAERAGFRPCLRCRPELAPGRALVDAVARLAHTAVQQLAAGALNGRSVAALAGDLGVSERHLRRALEREIGASPVEIAQTHRLLLAKRLLADTALSVTHVAYASGFQSLRRFNAAFQARYRMPPSALRRPSSSRRPSAPRTDDAALRLTLAYRPPFAWETLLACLRADAVSGVDLVQPGRFGRTVQLDGRRGIVFVAHVPSRGYVTVDVSSSLVPVLMPLLARLRHLFDLDAEPTVIDEHLSIGGLGALVARRPGLRIPGALDGFEVALRTLLRGRTGAVVRALGEPLDTGIATLSQLLPGADRVAEAGAARIAALGVPRRRAEALCEVARLVDAGALRLDPGRDAAAIHRVLTDACGLGAGPATEIVGRALDWPDAFAASSRTLWRAAGVTTAAALRTRAERWRPWRAYAALHLRLQHAAP